MRTAAILWQWPRFRRIEELCDERRRGTLAQLFRRNDLLDPAFVHHRDEIGTRERFLVVRDEDECDSWQVLGRVEVQ
jgi:hypothetical protein